MDSRALAKAFAALSTPLAADACLRLGLPLRVAPPGLAPVVPGARVAGRVVPARHFGSVDVFLEAMQTASPGDVLVVDNGGRTDEACVGDLTALEAAASGMSAMLVWGLHRDTPELREIGLPVFSYGRCAPGPSRLDPRDPDALQSARFGAFPVDRSFAVFADDDGAVFAPLDRAGDLLATAEDIRRRERAQADRIRAGETLRRQLRFDDYLARRAKDPDYTLRRHLREIGGAIEV
ncbi:MAG TPA: RraA family protein [Thermoanaerobaculia bacterium]|nr:RraA family protein [Thermoanaerobaculia bacterium]